MGKESLFQSGILSVTFRRLNVTEVARLAAEARLEAIEWGSDVHVPQGDTALAAETARITTELGLRVSGYASYYRVGDEPEGEFERFLESALALEAPTIRVWAGRLGSEKSDASHRARLVEDAQRIAERAASHGLTIDFEFHNNTLTDTVDSTVALMQEIGAPNVRSCWQPPLRQSPELRLADLQRVLPWLSSVHVFQWVDGERLPLRDGLEEWQRYLELIRTLGRPRTLLLEFVRNDEPEQLMRDAAALHELIAAVSAGRS